MRQSYLLYYSVTIIISLIGSIYLYNLGETSSWVYFYPVIILTGIALGGLFLSLKEYEEKENITNKYHFIITILISLISISILLTIAYKGFDLGEWSSRCDSSSAHFHGRRSGLIYFIINIINSIEPFWWGVIFSIYAVCLIPGTVNSLLSLLNFLKTNKQVKSKNLPEKEYQEKNKIHEENISKLIYSLIKKKIESGETNTLIPYLEKISVELDKDCVIENYYFDSEQQCEDAIDNYDSKTRNYEENLLNKVLIETELLSYESLKKLGETFKNYFYDNMVSNESLQNALLKGLQMRYIVSTKTLEEIKPIVITDLTLSEKDIIKLAK